MRSIRAIVSDIEYIEPTGSLKNYKHGVNPSKYGPGYLIKDAVKETPGAVTVETPEVLETRAEELKRDIAELQYPTKRQPKQSASFELVGGEGDDGTSR